ncbi:MAG: hypothetical protein DI562_19505 [Stenotrophomonas acidaminiphila]|nr:MAG: hypothetical protein DI562_19505 [Stenotrophomonas acidaminiphila]
MNPTESAWFDETLRIRCPSGKAPLRLYKFLSSSSKYFALAMHELFLHSRIRLSSRRDFNDPFDTQFGLDFPDSDELLVRCVEGLATRTNTEDYLQRVNNDLEVVRSDLSKNTSAALDKMGIYSLAESVRHPLMWAHYADSHRGVAVIFRHGTDDSFGAFPIRYQDEYPRGSIGEDGLPLHLCFVKGSDWQYEREWRIAKPSAAHSYLELDPSLLWGVVLGAKASRETCSTIHELIMRRAAIGLPGLRLYQAEVEESFELKFYQFVGEEDWQQVELA